MREANTTMARPPKRREASGRPTISIGVEVTRMIVDFPALGSATMKVYGRSAALAEGQADLSTVYIEETLDPKIAHAVADLLRPHLLPKLVPVAKGDKTDG